MGAEIHITELEAANAEVQYRIQHPAPVLLGPVTDGLRTLYAHIFDSEGAYAGDAWAPLSPETEAYKMRMGYPDAILIREGDLVRSLTVDNALGGYSEMRDEHTVAVGTDIDTGALHQGGTRNMPARPIAPDVDRIPAHDIEAWTELVANYILGDAF